MERKQTLISFNQSNEEVKKGDAKQKLGKCDSRKIMIDFSITDVTTEEELLAIVEYKNAEINYNNRSKIPEEREPLIDRNYLIERFRKIKNREEIRCFKEEHDCKNCMYHQKPRICSATRHCPLSEGKVIGKKESKTQSQCPLDLEGNCPYKNEVGTCFGICYRRIIREMNARRKAIE